MALPKLKKKRLFLHLIITLPVIIIAGYFLIIIFSQKPPVEKIESARKAIAQAVEAEGELYAPEQLELAKKSWQSAMEEWKLNNEKNPLFRSYSKAAELAGTAIQLAQEAEKSAGERRQQLGVYLEQNIQILKKSIRYIERATEKLPLNHNIRKRITPFAIKSKEAEQAYQRGDLLSANKKIEQIKGQIEVLRKETTTLLGEYFKDYSKWLRLEEEMIQWSKKKGEVALVIDKFSRSCIAYKGGKKYRQYDVELGVNWLGDKIQKGDKATPEGRYSITVKKSGSATIYYKALLINFPNEEDKRRFREMKNRGEIAKDAQIGGLIEIHGGGGKGVDWTDGCVALINRDMDSLFSICKVGTPLVIVGSLVPMEKIFNFDELK